MAILRAYVIGFALAFLVSMANAQQPAASASKYEPALDVTSMDRSADPCVDFFQYSCGGWIKNNPIPPDQSSWSLYAKMQDENLIRLREILEAAAAPDANRNPPRRRLATTTLPASMRRRLRPKPRRR